MKIHFVTGDDEKMRDAVMALKRYGIEVIKTPLDIERYEHWTKFGEWYTTRDKE